MSHDPETNLQREVGGLRCVDVLERLPDYLEATLEPADLAKVEAHLSGCTNCAKFGGLYGRAVAAMRGLAREGDS
jgi:anti-sigma factor RsiW